VLAVLDAPSNLGLRPPAPGREPGVRRLPDALRGCGLVERLHALDAGRVGAPPYSPAIDPATGVRNGAAMPAYTLALAERIGELVDESAFPVVLGGDCSILLAPMLALARRGTFGLAFLDGHLDFRHRGWSDAVGAVAGEDLAAVTGRAAPQLADIDGLGPYVADADVVAIGEREGDPAGRAAIAETAIAVLDLGVVRTLGVEAVAADALERLQRPYWIHVDADVIDSALLGAVDSPAPGGLTFAELAELLRRLLAGPAVGLQVTVFDPDLDPGGEQARELTDCLVSAFA
jgi:arginase